MSSVLLSIESLRILTANRKEVVADFSLTVHPGEIVALTGASGSGKTTIARAILGQLPPGMIFDGGKITWTPPEGVALQWTEVSEEWKNLPGRQIGFIQQDVFGAFDPILRLGTQMVMAIEERTGQSRDEILKDLHTRMEEVGLNDIPRLLRSYPHQLSGGQLQRCLICMALVMQPSLLIMDEPTSAIDTIHQQSLLELLRFMRDHYKMAILCISHEYDVVLALADKVISIGNPQEQSGKSFRATEGQGADTVLRVNGIVYQHAYGGLSTKSGALIGPVSFILRSGGCIGLIGESGSGKSTISQILVGLYKPLQGEIFLHGYKVDFLQPRAVEQLRRGIQLVLQDGRGSLHPYMTIEKILTETLLASGVSKSVYAERIRKILSECGLPQDVLDRKPATLSGGECLRVSIARSLLVEPAVLICDESTASLDSVTRENVLALLRNLRKERRLALIMISHDQALIRATCDEALVLADGKIVEQGAVDQLVTYGTHSVTRKIFGHRAT